LTEIKSDKRTGLLLRIVSNCGCTARRWPRFPRGGYICVWWFRFRSKKRFKLAISLWNRSPAPGI